MAKKVKIGKLEERILKLLSSEGRPFKTAEIAKRLKTDTKSIRISARRLETKRYLIKHKEKNSLYWTFTKKSAKSVKKAPAKKKKKEKTIQAIENRITELKEKLPKSPTDKFTHGRYEREAAKDEIANLEKQLKELKEPNMNITLKRLVDVQGNLLDSSYEVSIEEKWKSHQYPHKSVFSVMYEGKEIRALAPTGNIKQAKINLKKAIKKKDPYGYFALSESKQQTAKEIKIIEKAIEIKEDLETIAKQSKQITKDLEAIEKGKKKKITPKKKAPKKTAKQKAEERKKAKLKEIDEDIKMTKEWLVLHKGRYKHGMSFNDRKEYNKQTQRYNKSIDKLEVKKISTELDYLKVNKLLKDTLTKSKWIKSQQVKGWGHSTRGYEITRPKSWEPIIRIEWRSGGSGFSSDDERRQKDLKEFRDTLTPVLKKNNIKYIIDDESIHIVK